MDDGAATSEAAARPGRAMLVVSVVAGVVGLILLAVGVAGFLEASSANDEESELVAQRTEAEDELDALVEQRTELDERAGELDDAESAVLDSIDAQISAGNDFVERGNEILTIYQEAVDLGNSGDLAGERAKFENEGGAAVLEAAAALDEQRQAHAGYEELISALGEMVE